MNLNKIVCACLISAVNVSAVYPSVCTYNKSTQGILQKLSTGGKMLDTSTRHWEKTRKNYNLDLELHEDNPTAIDTMYEEQLELQTTMKEKAKKDIYTYTTSPKKTTFFNTKSGLEKLWDEMIKDILSDNTHLTGTYENYYYVVGCVKIIAELALMPEARTTLSEFINQTVLDTGTSKFSFFDVVVSYNDLALVKPLLNLNVDLNSERLENLRSAESLDQQLVLKAFEAASSEQRVSWYNYKCEQSKKDPDKIKTNLATFFPERRIDYSLDKKKTQERTAESLIQVFESEKDSLAYYINSYVKDSVPKKNDLENRIDNIKKEIEEKNKGGTLDLWQKHIVAREAKEEKEKNVEQAKKELNCLKTRLKDSGDAINYYKGYINQCDTDESNVKKQILELEKGLKPLQNKFQEKQHEIQLLKSKKNGENIQTIQKQIDQINDAIAQHKDTITKIENDLINCRDTFWDNQNSDLKKSLAYKDNAFEKKQEELAELQKTLKPTTESSQKVLADIAKEKEKMESLLSQRDTAEKKLKKLEEQKKKEDTELLAYVISTLSYYTGITDTSKEIKEAQEDLNNINASILESDKKLEQQKLNAEEELVTLNSSNKAIDNKIQKAEDELKDLQKKMNIIEEEEIRVNKEYNECYIKNKNACQEYLNKELQKYEEFSAQITEKEKDLEIKKQALKVAEDKFEAFIEQEKEYDTDGKNRLEQLKNELDELLKEKAIFQNIEKTYVEKQEKFNFINQTLQQYNNKQIDYKKLCDIYDYYYPTCSNSKVIKQGIKDSQLSKIRNALITIVYNAVMSSKR